MVYPFLRSAVYSLFDRLLSVNTSMPAAVRLATTGAPTASATTDTVAAAEAEAAKAAAGER